MGGLLPHMMNIVIEASWLPQMWSQAPWVPDAGLER